MPSPFWSSAGPRWVDREAVLAALRACAALLAERCPAVRQVVLFGSYATGRPTPRSDADILAVIDDDHRAAGAQILDIARDAFLQAPVPVDVYLITAAQLEAGAGVAAAVRNGSLRLV